MRKKLWSGLRGVLVADTELLFMLSPRDPRHKYALEILTKFGNELVVPDTALLEYEVVLKSRGCSLTEVKEALLAIKRIIDDYGLSEARTIDSTTMIRHLEIMERYGLSFFDSLIASSTLALGGVVVSDDEDFDRVDGLRRMSIAKSNV